MNNDLFQPGSSQPQLPRYIVVEGPIGVGKTALVKRMAEAFHYQSLLEQADSNPFLEKFYENRQQNALATQLFFLFQRARLLEDLHQQDLFEPLRIADFMIEKDRLFAELLLADEEFKLYDMVYQRLAIEAPRPDLVIYLQAPPHILLQRIQQRGLRAEQSINVDYLEQITEAYSRFFHFYDDAPLLIINAEQMDMIDDERIFRSLTDYMLGIRSGRHYFNPSFYSEALL
ncbi:MAG TPA: deoxynucleoside kinase [Pseudomonadales bacterium]